LAGLLLLNTLVAITIGLLVANALQPGRWMSTEPPPAAPAGQPEPRNPIERFLDSIPKSLLGPLGDEGNVLSVIFLA
jgi:DAACS family dicarboxylate/amino acid:cation (Na+ or H+) symporter